MSTIKTSQLNALTTADGSDLLVVSDVSEGTSKKITKDNLLSAVVKNSELTNETAVKAIDQGLATTDSPAFAGGTYNGDVTVGGALDPSVYVRSNAAGTTSLYMGDSVQADAGGIKYTHTGNVMYARVAASDVSFWNNVRFAPNSNGTYHLGSASNYWGDAYLSTVTTTGNAVFGGGVSLSGGSDVLDTYEEGTFTPVLADAASGGNLATATTLVGRYTKIGRVCHFSIVAVDIDTTGMTGANVFYVRGLPFTSSNTTHNTAVRAQNVAFSGVLTANIFPSQAYATLFDSITGSGGTNFKVSSITSGTADLYISGTYETV